MTRLSSLPYYEKWFIIGTILGIIIGAGITIYHLLLDLVEELFIFHFIGMNYPKPLGEGGTLNFVFKPGDYFLIPVATTIGGLIAGLVAYTFAPEAAGGGIDGAIKAYHYRQGKVRWIVAPVKIIASAFTLGSGESAGNEGPAAQLSASLNSFMSTLLHLSPEDRRIAVAVGIGAGIGTVFKTPIGGALLAAEVLYRRDLEPEVIYPAIVATAISYTIYGSVTGFSPILGYYTGAFDPLRLPMYAVLGLVSGLVTILYVKTFYGVQSSFERLKIPNHVKPAIGGAIAGLITLLAPEVMGEGLGWINLIEYERFQTLYSPILPVLALVVLLPFLKIFATSFTVGSGGSGGVFAPGLFIGAYIGASVGLLFHYLFPQIVPNIAPFVIIGMMSFFAAAGKVPIAVMLMVTEMTGGIQLLPDTMIAVAVSFLVSGNYTLYNAQMPTRRDSPVHKAEYEFTVLGSIKAKECQLINIKVNVRDNIEKAIQTMIKNNFTSLPVVDGNDNFIGVVYLRDIEKAKNSDSIIKYITRGSPYISSDSTLEHAMEIMARNRARWVAVVDKGKFVGILTEEAIVEAYNKELKRLRESQPESGQ